MAPPQPPVRPLLKKPPGYQAARPVPGTTPRNKAAPPLSLSFRPHHQPRSQQSSFCRVFCLVFCIFLLVLVIVVALATGIFFLMFDPRLPTVFLRSFQIPLFNTTAKGGGTYLDVWTVPEIEVKNPNGKLDIFYAGGLRADVNLGDPNNVGVVLGTKALGGFTQRQRNTTYLKFDLVVRNRLVSDSVAKKLKSDYMSKVLRVGVHAQTRLGYVVKGWRIATVDINVLCGGVTMRDLKAGKMPKCAINALKWINIK